MNKTFSWTVICEFAKKSLAQELWQLSKRVHGTMHIQRERQPERQTATIQFALKHNYVHEGITVGQS